MINESWKEIKGREGMNLISDYGRVKSLSRPIKVSNGFRISKERILKSNAHGRYNFIQLERRGKCFLIHRIVAEAFVNNPHEKSFVNHINGNKKDNRAENLEWVTGSENMIHAYKNGPQKGKGMKLDSHYKSRKIKVLKDGDVINRFNCIKRCAMEMNLRYGSICRVLTGERKKYHGFTFQYE